MGNDPHDSLDALVNYLVARVNGLKLWRQTAEQNQEQLGAENASLRAAAATAQDELIGLRQQVEQLEQKLIQQQQQLESQQAAGPGTPPLTVASPPFTGDTVSEKVLDAAREVANMLVRTPADRVDLDIQGRLAVSYAITGNVDKLADLLNADASLIHMRSLSKVGYLGFTLLHYAAEKGKINVCELLLLYGINPMITDLLGRTPLHVAAQKLETQTAKFFMDRMGDVRGENAPRDANGTTPAGYSALAKVNTEEKRMQRMETLKAVHDVGDASISPLRAARTQLHAMSSRRSRLSSEIPVTAAHIQATQRSPSATFQFGHRSLPGYRVSMEDAICFPDGGESKLVGLSLFAVFDGHGGPGAADFCAANLEAALARQPEVSSGAAAIDSTALQNALVRTCDELDSEMAMQPQFTFHEVVVQQAMGHEAAVTKLKSADHSGTTATILVVAHTFCVVANVGDSRTVLFDAKSLQILLATRDHTMPTPLPTQPQGDPDFWAAEAARIQAGGGEVSTEGRISVVGNPGCHLAMTRALGDFEFKQGPAGAFQKGTPKILECRPEVYQFERSADADHYVILACDGVWDWMPNETCVASFNEALGTVDAVTRAGVGHVDSMDAACNKVALQCLDSWDNISIMAVRLLPIAYGVEPMPQDPGLPEPVQRNLGKAFNQVDLDEI